MEVSKRIRKMIVFEFIALIFLIGVIIYSIFAIQKSNDNKVSSQDGMVVVLDDSKVQALESMSDGNGLETNGVTYTITNNNDYAVTYKVVLVPDVHDDKVLNQIRVSTDDMYIEDLTKLDRTGGGYVLDTYSLNPGYTKIHLIKKWYKLDTDDTISKIDVDFEYRLVLDK